MRRPDQPAQAADQLHRPGTRAGAGETAARASYLVTLTGQHAERCRAAPFRRDLEFVTQAGAGLVILIRPDGHVAARGRPGRMEAVTGYLRDLFGEPAEAGRQADPVAVSGATAD